MTVPLVRDPHPALDLDRSQLEYAPCGLCDDTLLVGDLDSGAPSLLPCPRCCQDRPDVRLTPVARDDFEGEDGGEVTAEVDRMSPDQVRRVVESELEDARLSPIACLAELARDYLDAVTQARAAGSGSRARRDDALGVAESRLRDAVGYPRRGGSPAVASSPVDSAHAGRLARVGRWVRNSLGGDRGRA